MMDGFKGTPGPLTVERFKHDESAYIVRTERGDIIAMFHSHIAGLSLEQAEANAKLFAASAESHEALVDAQRSLAHFVDSEVIPNTSIMQAYAQAKLAEAKARAAIAKAT
jgi:hypothetical protein